MDLGQEQDATVNGAVPLLITDHHGARPAVAFVTAFLGASQALGIAQPVQQSGGRRDVGQRHDFSVEKKSDVHRVRSAAVPGPLSCAAFDAT